MLNRQIGQLNSTSLVRVISMPKLCISRRICSFGSWIDDDGLVTIIEQIVSADPAIQRCLFICGMVYRFAGSRTNILRIKLSQSVIKVGQAV